MARATSKSSEPMPWPMSNQTPRSRAARISSRILPRAVERVVGERLEAVGEHVARAAAGSPPPSATAADSRDAPSAARPAGRRPPSRCPWARRRSARRRSGRPGPSCRRSMSPVLAAAGDRLAGVAKHDVAAFADHHVAREAVDAGEGDVEIGEDPRCASARSRGVGSPGSCPGRRCPRRRRWWYRCAAPARRRRRPSDVPPQ